MSRTLVVLLCLAAPAFAQDDATPPKARSRIDANGFDGFRGLLQRAGLKPIDTFDKLLENPREHALVVLGSTRLLSERTDELRYFLSNGGTVLIASDTQTEVNLVSLLGGGVTGARLISDDPDDCFSSKPDCPFVALPRRDPETLPLFRNLERVATNSPSFLLPGFGTGPPLAYLPDSCRVRVGDLRSRRLISWPFAAYRRTGPGQVVVLADHSLFINAMLLLPDADNFELGENVANWLAGPGPRKRTGVLLSEEGVVRNSFEVFWRDPPPPSLKEILDILKDNPRMAVAAVNAVAAAAQEPDGPLRELSGPRSPLRSWLAEQFPPRRLFSALLVIAAVAVGLVGLFRASLSRARGPGNGPVAPPPRATAPPTYFEQRIEELAAAGNWSAVAREEIAGQLTACGLLPEGQARPPRVAVLRGNWLARRRTRRQLLALWQLAFGPPSKPLDADAWAEQSEQLAELVARYRAGGWRFEPPG